MNVSLTNLFLREDQKIFGIVELRFNFELEMCIGET